MNPSFFPIRLTSRMASSSHSTSIGAASQGTQSVEAYRDVAGFLPLVSCLKCGTKLIGRVSQTTGSKGKRFYKCPFLEHTASAFRTYMFEENYVEYLVAGGHLPRGCSQMRGLEGSQMLELLNAGTDLTKACQGVQSCQDVLHNVVIHLKASKELLKALVASQNSLNNKIDLKDLEEILKALVASHTTLNNKIDKIGERMLVVAVAILFVLVLVLLVLLIK